jgi:hypothetical protein
LDPIFDFVAETIPPKGGGRRVKVATTETQDIVQPGIFYGGYKRKDFVFPVLTSGAIGRISYSRDITDPHLLPPFFFDEHLTVKSSEYSVTVPETINIQYRLFGLSTEKINFHKEQTQDGIKYIWKMNDVPAWRYEPDAPARAYTSPHLMIFIDSFRAKGQTHKVVSDVNDLYSWYSGLIKKIPSETNGKDVDQLVSDLVKGAKSDREKVHAIFQWVQKNIRYVAFEDGMAGFIPRSAIDVYVKRYGDCKDMANLLKYMINKAGIDAYHTWIGSRNKPYSYKDVPSAVADDHMICSIKLDNQYIFLDATSPFVAFGNPTSMIQGKEALIGIDDKRFEIVKVPVLEGKFNTRIDSVFISSSEKGIVGKVSSELNGYRKDDLEVSSMKASLQQDKEYIRDFFEIGSNNILIHNVSIKGLGDATQPGSIGFEFLQPGYSKSIGDKLYINLAINKSSPGEKIGHTRLQAVEKDYFFNDVTVTVYDIPPGYSVLRIPENKTAEWPEFGFRSSYEVSEGQVLLKREVYSNILYLEKAHFESWNKFIQELADVNNQTVVFATTPAKK